MAYKFIDNKVKKDGSIPATINDYMLYYGGIKSQGQPLLNTSSFIDYSFINDTGDTDMTESEWFTFIMQTNGYINSNYPYGKIPNQVNIVDSIIYDKYKDRELLPKITDCFEEPFTNYEPFPNMSYDRQALEYIIHGLTYNVLSNNRKKYEKLFTALTAEFNPLWNVDGTETTVRTLERDGTETTAKTGTVSDLRTGTETSTRTGTDTTEHTGTDTYLHSGTETDAHTGTDSLTKTGTVSDRISGSDTTTKTGTETTVISGSETKTIDTDKAAFNTSQKQPVESVTDETQYNNKTDTTTYNTTDTLSHNTTDTVTNNTTDTTLYSSNVQTTKNLQDQRTALLEDETTYNTTDQLTHNVTDQTTHNTTDRLTLDTTDTERIEHIRQGNIGVISTVKLLQEYIDFADQLDFFSIVAADIAENVSMLTY